jgi:transposase InsO family protein
MQGASCDSQLVELVSLVDLQEFLGLTGSSRGSERLRAYRLLQASPHNAQRLDNHRSIKAEALIKTMLREWARRHAYPSSAQRAAALAGYLRWYNNHTPHGSLAAQPPISRVSHVRGYST